MSHSLLDRASALASIFACLAIGGAALYRGLGAGGRVMQVDVSAPPRPLANWQSLTQYGVTDGPASAAVQVIEFSDLECPFCRRFHSNLENLRSRYGGHVAMTFIHYPLKTHRFAALAAQGAECARLQGSFFPFVSRTFSVQDSLGLVSWTEIARGAGITDTLAFTACQSAQPSRTIADGKRVGDSIGIKGTPAVVINGFYFAVPPDSAQLDSLARAALKQPARARLRGTGR